METKILTLARQEEARLIQLRETCDRRSMRYSESRDITYTTARLTAFIDVLDAIGVDRTEFNWIF